MLNFRAHSLQVKRTSGGGYDSDGNPIPVVPYWEPIMTLPIRVLEIDGERQNCTPCHYATNQDQDLLRYMDGVFRVFDYQVWIDPITEDLTSKYVRLIDQYGKIEVQEKQVQKCVNRQLTTKFYL